MDYRSRGSRISGLKINKMIVALIIVMIVSVMVSFYASSPERQSKQLASITDKEM